MWKPYTCPTFLNFSEPLLPSKTSQIGPSDHLCATANCCMSAARISDRHLAQLHNCTSTSFTSDRHRLCVGSSRSLRPILSSASASQAPTYQKFSGSEHFRDHSQPRRGGQLLEANGRQRVALQVCEARRSDSKDRRVSSISFPLPDTLS